MLKPTLTKEASETIAEEYSKLRSQDTEHTDMARTQPVTARALETLIRLATAHAKARLSVNVEVEDAEAAIEMVQFAYYKKVVQKPKKTRHRENGEATDGEEAKDDEAMDQETPAQKRKRTEETEDSSSQTKKAKKKKSGES